jgi:hypothetical protein
MSVRPVPHGGMRTSVSLCREEEIEQLPALRTLLGISVQIGVVQSSRNEFCSRR